MLSANMTVTSRSRHHGARAFPCIYMTRLVLGTLVLLSLYGRTDSRQLETPSTTREELFDNDAIDRLSRVFGISRVPVDFHHRAPPQYMVELFDSITDEGGLVKSKTPFDADVVRSFPDRGKFTPFSLHRPL